MNDEQCINASAQGKTRFKEKFQERYLIYTFPEEKTDVSRKRSSTSPVMERCKSHSNDVGQTYLRARHPSCLSRAFEFSLSITYHQYSAVKREKSTATRVLRKLARLNCCTTVTLSLETSPLRTLFCHTKRQSNEGRHNGSSKEKKME